jgi:hypothetical protein
MTTMLLSSGTKASQGPASVKKRLRPERGGGANRGGAAAPSESERGCPPSLVALNVGDQLRRGLAVARTKPDRAEAEGPASVDHG